MRSEIGLADETWQGQYVFDNFRAFKRMNLMIIIAEFISNLWSLIL